MILIGSLLTLAVLPAITHGFVIAPPWANPVINPCSGTSWQLIYWPPDGRCYQIFEKGPCPDTQELAFHAVSKRATCRCPKNLRYWPETDRCYPEHSRGPCEVNQYLKYESEVAVCQQTKICENGWIFWPPLQDCFQLYTQGPCHKGDLLIMNPLTAEPICGCDPMLLKQYYSPPLKLCYEHFTRGPCESGLLFAYNHTSDATQCLCNENLVNFYSKTSQCFQFDTKGPCRKGQMFQYSKMTGRGECLCRKGYVYWPPNGECYKAFTAGPCRPGQFLIPHQEDENIGQCVVNPCPRAHLYFPPVPSNNFDTEVKCHKVGSRGPCPLGQLVVFEKYSGKSYRGECGCSPGYNQNYWPETGQCFEWYTQGPCKDSFLFQYNRDSGRTECVCDEQEGFVFWNETQKCYRVYTQGPCPNNAWLIPADDLTEVFCECQAGYHFSPSQYACRRTPMVKSPLGSNPGLHLLLKNHKMYPTLSTSSDDYDEDEIENATDEPNSGLEWSRGIFVSASATDDSAIGENTSKKSGEGNNNNKNGEILQITHLQQDTARIDTGITSGTIADKFNWMKNRHKWEWWQKARQPRQPWASPNRRRRKRRRRRLVNLKA